jgi:hypothetical protein
MYSRCESTYLGAIKRYTVNKWPCVSLWSGICFEKKVVIKIVLRFVMKHVARHGRSRWDFPPLHKKEMFKALRRSLYHAIVLPFSNALPRKPIIFMVISGELIL